MMNITINAWSTKAELTETIEEVIDALGPYAEFANFSISLKNDKGADKGEKTEPKSTWKRN